MGWFPRGLFLSGSFRNLEDLNVQLRHRLDAAANPRVHATTERVVNETFAEERPALVSLPLLPYRTVLRLERRISNEGMISIGGNSPDTTKAPGARGPQHGRRDPYP